jgi:hypothetical protein
VCNAGQCGKNKQNQKCGVMDMRDEKMETRQSHSKSRKLGSYQTYLLIEPIGLNWFPFPKSPSMTRTDNCLKDIKWVSIKLINYEWLHEITEILTVIFSSWEYFYKFCSFIMNFQFGQTM